MLQVLGHNWGPEATLRAKLARLGAFCREFRFHKKEPPAIARAHLMTSQVL